MRAVGRRAVGLVLAGTGLVAMSACGTQDPEPSDPPRASTGVGSPTPTPTPTSDDGLEQRATAMLIPDGSLGDGWRLSDPPQPGFRLTVCGVDIEPEEPRGVALRRFARTGLGPFVVQYVEAHRAGLADEVVADLRAALPGCSRFSSRGESPDSPEETFVLDPDVDFGAVPDDGVVFRMTSQGEREVTQDVALVARGEFLVGVVSFVAGGPPDPAVITSAVAGVPQEP